MVEASDIGRGSERGAPIQAELESLAGSSGKDLEVSLWATT